MRNFLCRLREFQLVTLAIVLPGLSLADTGATVNYMVGTYLGEPMAEFKNGNLVGGIVKDFGAEIEKSSGKKVNIVLMPRKRVGAAVSDGEIDIVCFVNPAWLADSSKVVWSTKPLLTLTDQLFGSEAARPIERVEELTPNDLVSTVLGYKYEKLEGAFDKGTLHRDDSPSQRSAIGKVESGHSLYGIAEDLTLDWFVRYQSPKHIAKWRLPIQSWALYCGVPKASKYDARQLLSITDNMIDSGKVQKITDRSK